MKYIFEVDDYESQGKINQTVRRLQPFQKRIWKRRKGEAFPNTLNICYLCLLHC
ncbi:hypothetical protein Hdeb2414_s0003g00094991 [Helianthus debilis subsp. tardiflorus]